MSGARIAKPSCGWRRQVDDAIGQRGRAAQGSAVIEIAQHRSYAECPEKGRLAPVTDEPIHRELSGKQRGQTRRHIAKAHNQYSHRLSIV